MEKGFGVLRQDAIRTIPIALATMSSGSISTGDEVRTKEQRGNVSARLGQFSEHLALHI